MKHSTALTAVLLSSFAFCVAAQTPTTAAAPADAPAADGPSKIGVIAFQQAVTATNEFQRNFGDLQKKWEPKRQELKALSDQIENMKKQLQTQGDALSDQERETRA